MISVIIVNWNSSQLTLNCLAFLEKYNKKLVEKVIVVDNDSKDNFSSLLFKYKSTNFAFSVIRNSRNMGFAWACNQGARQADSDFILFLNPDMELHDESLVIPYQFMSQPVNVGVGIVGIQLTDSKSVVSRSCVRFPNLSYFFCSILGIERINSLRHLDYLMSDWEHLTTSQVDHVIGAFFFVRKSLFSQLGGFDEDFFVYYEDLDFSLRSKNLGWKTVYLCEASAYHMGGGSSEKVKAHRLFYSLRSKIIYGFKHFRRIEAYTLLFLVFSLEFLTRLVFVCSKFSKDEILNTIYAYSMLFMDLPNIFKIIYKNGKQYEKKTD